MAGSGAVPHFQSRAPPTLPTPMLLESPPLPSSLEGYSSSRMTRRRSVNVTVSPGRGTLQAALDSAAAGDRLVLEAGGTYTGSGRFVLRISQKNITIWAPTSGGAVLDGENARVVISFGLGAGDKVVLSGLQITRGNTKRSGLSDGGGINIDGGTVNINNCAIHNNQATTGGGLCIARRVNAPAVNIISCTINNNQAYGVCHAQF